MTDSQSVRVPAAGPGADRPSRPDRRFFGHPLALATPAATEVFERFSFYGMRSTLAAYLLAPVSAGGMGLAAATALSLTAIYSASAYLSSIAGGWLHHETGPPGGRPRRPRARPGQRTRGGGRRPHVPLALAAACFIRTVLLRTAAFTFASSTLMAKNS
ncbi:hypothetical protein [Streptomyces brasiliensis]|uniref:MFS transporter n=1 Tax=Streptomyces brasiliensis TaxID=1954 RepID=A0A917P8M4_9ACTN|nr:hypothetical protein [Streptomyces brasiliensis]GGJ66836.1 hypothetical protein GCM10010121_091870 [Streptomyces brasiliensis]